MATTANRLRLDDVMKDRGLARDPPQERPSIEDSPVMEAFFNKVGALPDTLYSITGIPRAVGVAREGRSQGILGQYHPSKDSVALRPIYSRDRSVNNPPAENLSDQMAGTFIHEMGHRLQDSIQGRQLEAAAGFTDKLSDEEERILELENRAFETMQDVNLDSVSTPFNLRRAQRHPPEAFAHTFGRAMQALRRAQKKARESDRIPAEVLDEEVKKEEDTAPAVGEFVDYFLDQPIFQGSEMRRSRDIRSAKQGRVPARDHTRVSRPPEGSPIIETLWEARVPHNPLTTEEALSPAARSSTRVRAPDEEEEGRGRPAQVTRRSAFDAFTDDVRQFTAGNPVFELLDFVAKQGGRFLGAEPGGASLVPWLGGSKSLGNVVSKRIGPASGRVRNVGADEGFFSKMFNLSEEAPENFARAREVAGSKPAREGSEALQGALMQEQDLRRTMLEPLSTLDRSRLQGAINALERPKSTATLRAIMGNVEGMTPRRQIDDITEAVGEADRAAIETLLEQARNF